MKSVKMFFLFILTLILQGFNANKTICDSECVCRINNKGDQDFNGEIIDCSYKIGVFNYNYSLPTTVHSLNLSSNNLTAIPSSCLLQSKTMVELLLNNNYLKEIKSNVLDLPELKRLDLRDNLLEHVHEDTFRNMKKLEYLNLANNKFTSFEKLTFHHLSNLRELVLDNNDVGPSLRKTNLFDRNGFGLTHKIDTLSICRINLNVVPENFFVDSYDIRKVAIAGNNLTDVFELPYTLEYLDLSDNPIEEISIEDFSDLPALKELKLNNLQINEIPDFVFSPLHSLVNLELERNRKLTNFSKLAFGREVLEDADDFLLEKLSLTGSRLSTLDKQLLEPFAHLVKLDLQGNPWSCDCNLVWMKKLKIPPNDYEHLR